MKSLKQIFAILVENCLLITNYWKNNFPGHLISFSRPHPCISYRYCHFNQRFLCYRYHFKCLEVSVKIAWFPDKIGTWYIGKRRPRCSVFALQFAAETYPRKLAFQQLLERFILINRLERSCNRRNSTFGVVFSLEPNPALSAIKGSVKIKLYFFLIMASLIIIISIQKN